MKKLLFASLMVMVACASAYAAKPSDMTHVNSLWISDYAAAASTTPDVTPGEDDMYIQGTLEVDGAARFDGAVTLPTGDVSSGEIADVTRSVEIPLLSFMVETSGNGSTKGSSLALLSATASTTQPYLGLNDSAMSIVWTAGVTSPVQVGFTAPTGYVSGGTFKVMATESNSSKIGSLDHDIYVTAQGATPDAAATNQTPVALTGEGASPVQVTLTPATDTFSAGDFVLLRIWPSSISAGQLEVKSVLRDGTFTQ